MDPVLIGLLGIAALIILLVAGFHICATLAIVGFVGLIFLINLKTALGAMGTIPFNTINSYNFAVLPLFMFMGEIVSKAGIGDDAYKMANAWLGQLKGGLAMATVVACGLFACICGSSAATAVTMGKMSIPEMEKMGYNRAMAIGSCAAGGTLGVLIPPSVALVLLGLLTEVSIGKLFIAGIIPGLIEILAYLATIYIVCMIKPEWAPGKLPTTWETKFTSLGTTWPIIVLFLFVIGGIYGGVFSPTEAGSMGAFGAIVIGLAMRRLSRNNFLASVKDATKTTAMIIALMLGAFIFTNFLTLSKIPFVTGEWVTGLGLSRVVFLIIIAIVFYIIGAFFDMFTVVIITTPLFFPMAIAMGVDPIWWCVFMVMEIEAGMASPPFGMNLFMMAAATKTDLGTVYRGVIPFTIADLVRLGIIIAFPITVTWLPNMML